MHGWRSVSHGTHMGRTLDTRDMRGTHGTLSHAASGRPLIPSHAGVHPMSDRSGSNAAPLPRPATLSPTPRLPCPFLCFSFLIRLSSSQAMGSLGLGDSMNDALVERFWSIIQHLSGKGGGGTSGGTAGGDLSRPLVTARPGARVPGLALTNTRDYVKQLDEELREEAAKAAGGGALPGPPPLPPAGGAGGRRDGEASREEEREQYSRDRAGGDRRRSRSRSRGRGRDEEGGGRHRRSSRSRSRGERDGRSRRERSPGGGGGGGGREMLPPPPPLQQLPDVPVLGGVYQGVVSGLMDFGCFVEIQGFRRKVGLWG